jgi:hypothetical protein
MQTAPSGAVCALFWFLQIMPFVGWMQLSPWDLVWFVELVHCPTMVGVLRE